MPDTHDEVRLGGELDEHVDSHALFRALLDSTIDLVWTVDPERFAVQSVSRAARTHLRRSRGLSIRIGMTPDELFPDAELSARWKGYYGRAISEGSHVVEYPLEDESLVVELRFASLREHDRVLGLAVFARDVTEQKRAEHALRASEAFYRTVQEASPDVSLVIGPDLRFRFVSAACVEQLGYSVEEMLANTPLALTHPDDRDRMGRTLEYVLATDGARVERQRLRVRHRDGSWRHIELVARNRLSSPAVGGVVVNTRDVTEQVRLAGRVHHAREEEKARVARDLHDQLGSLLTALQLDLEWVEDELDTLPPTPAVHALLEHAVAASETARQTLTEVQRIATDLRPASLDRIGLGAALRQEARRFQARTGIASTVEVPDVLPGLAPDAATALYRICQEALTNVARHSNATHVAIRVTSGDGRISLVVDDDGVGLAPARADHASALGLAGMRERAALEGGHLSLTPGTDGGTRVEACLPLAAQGIAP